MSVLFCFGLSYSAAAYVAAYGAQFSRIAGTVRKADKAAQLAAQGFGGRMVEAFVFGDAEAEPALAQASLLLISIPPAAEGDLALVRYGETLRRATALRAIVYLSTIGVYGDHGGGWVDETTPPAPLSRGSAARLAAERQWQDFGRARGVPVAVMRLPGIYGPTRNALANLRRGNAHRIVKPGQVFNRIHVRDIAQAIEAAYARRADGVFNICDDEPAPAQDVVAFAADLLGVAPPPEIPFEVARQTLPPMALGFYAECKRARNARMKQDLSVTLAYPTYRDGLRALHEAGDDAA